MLRARLDLDRNEPDEVALFLSQACVDVGLSRRHLHQHVVAGFVGLHALRRVLLDQSVCLLFVPADNFPHALPGLKNETLRGAHVPPAFL